ncbi:hypothetical protein EDB19DRAFT_2038912 [Suillus lakei]|nr:hypothetical protein EDB19DRAFT_2038912 [Suillus lakei]
MSGQSTGPMLPPPSVDQPFMYVSAFERGNIRVHCDLIVDGSSQGESMSCPTLAFSLRHSETKPWVVFDLGIRRDLEGYITLSQGRIKAIGIGDHEPFTRGTFVAGEGCMELLTSRYPMNPDSLFSSTALPLERSSFLPLSDFSLSIGPFLALDYFGDGSMYIIDAPGHVRRHINKLARTSPDGAWILLGGDSAHDYRLITGEREIAHNVDSSGRVKCAHGDKEKAAENIARIRPLLGIPRV